MEAESARKLWFRHVEPTLWRCLEKKVPGVASIPLLHFFIEAESLFESQGLIWAQGRRCRDPTTVWLLVGARLLLPHENVEDGRGAGVESVVILVVDSHPVVEFVKRALPGSHIRRV